MLTKLSIMVKASMLVMKMVMVFTSRAAGAVHCNTQEGVWSLLRSWLRPHRGVSQEKLPFYVGFFEWIHNLRKRGKHALHETFCLLLKPDLRTYQDCIIVSPI